MDNDKRQIIDFRELGQSGLRRFSGFIYDEFLPELTGWHGASVYKEMINNDATVGAILYAITMLCRKVKWQSKPASEDPADVEAADFLHTCMDDMSSTWADTITEILTMLSYGFSLHEIVYKRRYGDVVDPSARSKYADGRIGWRKIPLRSQDTIYRWQFDDHGGIQGAEQIAPPHYYLTMLPIEKCLLFRTTIDKNNPEGKSIFRTAYRSWYIKKNIENIEAIGVERDLAGLPMALVPPELLSSKRSAQETALYNEIKNIVVNIRRDAQEGVVFPSAYDSNGKLLYELKLLTTGGQRQLNTNDIINRWDQRIAMASLADFILLGSDKVGSYALSTNKTQLFTTAIGAHLDMIAEVFNRFAIPRLFAMNDFKISAYPTLEHDEIDQVDLKELGDFIQKLAVAGMPLFPNFELEKKLMRDAKLPEPVDDVSPEKKIGIVPSVPNSPKELVEIPANPITMPSNADLVTDTTPVNGAPRMPETLNGAGSFLPPRQP